MRWMPRSQDPSDVSYFAITNNRARYIPFGIKQADRLHHMYVIGKTGTGKSTLLETLLAQDIDAGRGCCLIDPHGDLAERVVARVPEHRRADLTYVNIADPDQPWRYNPLTFVPRDKRSLVASGMLEVFQKMWPAAWGQRMEHILRNTLLALLEHPDTTLADVSRLYNDKAFRAKIVTGIKNDQVHAFWKKEFPHYNPRYLAEAVAPIQNKVGALLADPRLLRFLTESDNRLRLRRLMDERRILAINLAKGVIGEDSAKLLGGLLVTAMGLAAFTRADIAPAERRPFFLYVDEFQSFTTLSVANMIAELRKYRIGLVLAHQYLHQLELDVRHAVIGNAGTLVAFRLGAEDAVIIARELAPRFTAEDLLLLANHHLYLKLMIDNAPSMPFSGISSQPDSAVRARTGHSASR
jgi:hypothetical protein